MAEICQTKIDGELSSLRPVCSTAGAVDGHTTSSAEANNESGLAVCPSSGAISILLIGLVRQGATF